MSPADIERVWDQLGAIENLPTVRNGMRALRMRSLLEWWLRRESIVASASPYTHPLQRPYFFLPGIPARPFYDSKEFPWTEALEAATSVIRGELEDALRRGDGFQPFTVAEDFEVSPKWNALYLYVNGSPYEGARLLCPETMRVIEAVPRFRSLGIACFSAMNPGLTINTHFGAVNGILRVHLGLVGDPGCRLRVGNDERTWKEGKVLIFDDSFGHGVVHRGARTRIILFFDIWHPAWSDEEIAILSELQHSSTVDARAALQAQLRSGREQLRERMWWS